MNEGKKTLEKEFIQSRHCKDFMLLWTFHINVKQPDFYIEVNICQISGLKVFCEQFPFKMFCVKTKI